MARHDESGELAELIRSLDWSATSVGPERTWPRSLQIAVRIMLDSRYAMWLGWGPELTFFYNDAYARMTLGRKHPWALGRPTRDVWPEIWEEIGPRAQSVITTGQATWDERLLLFLERRGFPEETYHTFSYSPLPDDHGGVGGMLCVVTEDTQRTIGERRLRTLRELAARTSEESSSVMDACQRAASTLAENDRDLPFVLVYLLDGTRARLAGAGGLSPGSAAAPWTIDLTDAWDQTHGWQLAAVRETGSAAVVTALGARVGIIRAGAWPEPPDTALVLPVTTPGQQQLTGFIVAGLSPRLAFDDEYRGFLDLVAGSVSATVANARAYEEERRRAEALEELDRAKTAFFANVSHEFRTPLTLMLSPVEGLIEGSASELSPAVREDLELVHRNGLRLRRLVDTLLDFSRLGADRLRAQFQPTDLATFTTELASVFESICERAGLAFTVDCPPLGAEILVDREMWEKVVLNLLSNAFKFTRTGGIAVTLRPVGDAAELRVRDTGTGIPSEEMPRLFERFHRIENPAGRTNEGSGIGLALVQELVKLHGGSVRAESMLGVGTAFVVRIPFGRAHLPPGQVHDDRSEPPSASRALRYLDEALGWLPEPAQEVGTPPSGIAVNAEEASEHDPLTDERPYVLLVDDNADIRQYVSRLLGRDYRVAVVADGAAALAATRETLPDLVLTDVMMPRLDGVGLLRALRSEPRTREIPVIMLSARAGEESRVEGRAALADDYLVKPFSGRELQARVGAQLQMARLRRESRAALADSAQELRERERQLRLVADNAPVMIAHCDADERYKFVNRAYADLVGAPREEILGRRIAEMVDADVYARCAPHLAAALDGRAVEFDLQLSQASGDTRVLQCALVPERDGERVVGLVAAIVNITDRNRVELEARDARARLDATLAAGEIGTWELDLVANTLRADQNIARILGVEPGEALAGRPLDLYLDAVHADDLTRVKGDLEAAIASGENLEVECRYVRSDGVRWIVTRGKVERDGNARAVRLRGATMDITAQRTAEERERQMMAESAAASAKFRALFDQGALFAVLLQLDGTIVDPNRAWVEGAGFTREGLVGAPFWHGPWWASSSALRDRVRTAVTQAAAGAPFHAELPYVVADGTERLIEASIVPIKDDAGHALFVAFTALDITERKRAEEALRRKAEEMETLLETLPIGVLIAHDAECRVITGNRAAHELLRTDNENISKSAPNSERPRHFRVFQGGVELEPEQMPVQRAARGESVQNEDIVDVFDDGTVVHTLMSAAPLFDERGEVRGAIASVLDVTARTRQEEALREGDRRKNEFLATLAHELRNPLAPLQNGLHLVRAGANAGDMKRVEQARAMMERQLTQLVRLVDDLLDVSRISQGKLEIRTAPVDLALALESAMETSRPLFDEMHHRLEVRLPESRIAVDGDFTRLAQVFMNLLNNAAKYSEPGGRIRLAVHPEGSDVLVTVGDDGIGIAREQLPRIFDVFSQVDHSIERSRGGIGIGLSLVKRLVEMHGGSIEATSDGPGRGSQFVVRLPRIVQAQRTYGTPSVVAGAREVSQLATSMPAYIAADGDRPASQLRILVVDDNRDSADTLALVLQMLGAETCTAYDGEQASRLAAEMPLDVVLLDIGLPKLNGYETCRRIRRLPGGERIIIVAQTGWGQKEDRQRTAEAGFDGHLVKPVDAAHLMTVLAGLRVARGQG